MRPRGCLRPSPPSTECRGGLCACAAWRLRRGRYYLSNAADAGFARRPPPFGRYMTGAARFPSGMRPDASGGRLGRPASAGQPSTGARGVVPLPPCICSGDAAHLLMSFLSGGVARDGCFIYVWFSASVLQAASPGALMKLEKRPETHACLLLLPLRTFSTEPCINNSALSSFGFSQAPRRERCSREPASHTDLRRRRRGLSVSARTPSSPATRASLRRKDQP